MEYLLIPFPQLRLEICHQRKKQKRSSSWTLACEPSSDASLGTSITIEKHKQIIKNRTRRQIYSVQSTSNRSLRLSSHFGRLVQRIIVSYLNHLKLGQPPSQMNLLLQETNSSTILSATIQQEVKRLAKLHSSTNLERRK